MEKILCPSMMCANYGHLADEVRALDDAGANIIYIHPESERYVVKALAHIKERGKLSGIAVNPDTSVASISEILNLCDYVMVMTVNPGFAGQGFIDFTAKKIAQLVELKKRIRLQADDRWALHTA
ncbi:MAG: hypothetical protein II153_07455 [Erysipelotrichaceae bacterium]|nr:hypothetical protein [Erysipelotrichaceae bacterium]MBQ5444393.1 hypothetical protein [Erysipelotrichaceae bacterium]